MSQAKTQAAISSSTLFGLLRHGLTIWNEEKRIQGRLDSPLSENGRTNIRNFIPLLKGYQWNRVIASDLGRVQETVSIINRVLGLPVSYDKRLREINWGEWEGLRLADVRTEYAAELSEEERKGWDFRAPGGESRREVLQRVKASLMEAAEQWHGDKILVVCHLGVIKCLIYDILQREFMPKDKKLINTKALHLISLENSRWNCRQLNIHEPG